MKVFRLILLAVFALVTVPMQAQSFDYTEYETKPLVNEVKTLRCLVDGDFMKLPVIDIQGNSKIEISFDYLADEQPWLSYSIVHCDANWKQDDLSELDYIDGFMPVKINDVNQSFNTFIQYFHYSVTFPNEDVTLKASGNYAVIFFPDDDMDNPVAMATFSVNEQAVLVDGEVSGNTDIDYRQAHQQLSLRLTWSNSKLQYINPESDINVVVRQNHRNETRREIKQPSMIEASSAIYEHNRDLIFNAGNNYRRFEFTDERYATQGIENLRYHAPYYYVNLLTDLPRNNSSYYYDQDQNGRYKVHALRVDNEDTEAEYFKALFTLKAPEKLDSDGVYLSGDFTYGKSDDFRMQYDEETGTFNKEVLLKQGAYNYQYLVDDSTSAIEGDYYENENEYDVMVYYHPFGARYDRLIGFGNIMTTSK